MARTRRSLGAGSASSHRGGIRVLGVYARLLEQERKRGNRIDPRWARTEAGRRGEPCPDEWREKSSLLPALEAGEPVELPSWRLGGLSEPDERLRRTPHDDRSIVGWLVHADDTVVPVRRGDEP
jgi:hypothetical protein